MIAKPQKAQKNAFSQFMVFNTPTTAIWLFTRPRLKMRQPRLKTSEGGQTILRCGFSDSNAHRGVSARFSKALTHISALFTPFLCYQKSDPLKRRLKIFGTQTP